MLTRHDIDALSDEDVKALEVADKIVERAVQGHPPLRLWSADQELQFIRAYRLMRRAAEASAEFIADHHARQLDAMSLAKPERADE
jgi:hypothetical protein